MYDTYARAFKSSLTLPEILARFNEVGPWRWIERDNDRFGEYISTRVLFDPDRGFLKVFVEPDHYAINVLVESERADAQAAFDRIRGQLFDTLLPAIGAHDIEVTGTYE